MNLIQAVKKGTYLNVVECLNRKEPIEMRDISGYTALHWAAIKGNATLIELLISRGANQNQIATRLNLTPLHLATMANHKQAVKKLIAMRVDLEVRHAKGDTALETAIKFNSQADSLLSLAKFIPGFDLLPKLDKGFDSIFALLKNGAQVTDVEILNDVVVNALIHDRADILALCMEKGFDYKKLNSDESAQAGFDYALIMAVANCSVKCLQFLCRQDPLILQCNKNQIGGLLNCNIMTWMIEQMPDRRVFLAPLQFFEMQEIKKLSDEQIREKRVVLPAVLSDCEVDYAYDNVNKRYTISKVMYGLCAVYFDKQGQAINLEAKLENLRQTLQFLKEHGIDFNQVDNLGEMPSSDLVKCPAQIIQVFCEFGVKFTGRNLHRAIRSSTPEIVRLLIEAGAPVSWRNSENQNAQALLMETCNDSMLNSRGELSALIQEKAFLEATASLTLEIPLPSEEFTFKDGLIKQMLTYYQAKPLSPPREVPQDGVLQLFNQLRYG